MLSTLSNNPSIALYSDARDLDATFPKDIERRNAKKEGAGKDAGELVKCPFPTQRPRNTRYFFNILRLMAPPMMPPIMSTIIDLIVSVLGTITFGLTT